MAEEKAEAPVQEEKKRSSGLMLLLGGLLVGALVAGGIVYMMLGGDAEKSDSETDVQEEDVATLAGNTSIKKLEDFNVNLRDPAGAKKLQMVISLEVKPTVAKLMEKPEIIDSIRDTIIMFASEFTVENLDGLDGKMGLRDGIELRINTVLSPQKVERVYFTKFIY